MNKIIQNAARCLHCKEIVISASTHHMSFCSCNSIAVDGGREYIKHTGPQELIDDLSLYQNSSPEKVHEKLLWGTRGKDGTKDVEYKFVTSLDTDHLEAILRTQVNAASYIKEAIATELRIRKINTVLE